MPREDRAPGHSSPVAARERTVLVEAPVGVPLGQVLLEPLLLIGGGHKGGCCNVHIVAGVLVCPQAFHPCQASKPCQDAAAMLQRKDDRADRALQSSRERLMVRTEAPGRARVPVRWASDRSVSTRWVCFQAPQGISKKESAMSSCRATMGQHGTPGNGEGGGYLAWAMAIGADFAPDVECESGALATSARRASIHVLHQHILENFWWWEQGQGQEREAVQPGHEFRLKPGADCV
jgi:hypothetical protein